MVGMTAKTPMAKEALGTKQTQQTGPIIPLRFEDDPERSEVLRQHL